MPPGNWLAAWVGACLRLWQLMPCSHDGPRVTEARLASFSRLLSSFLNLPGHPLAEGS